MVIVFVTRFLFFWLDQWKVMVIVYVTRFFCVFFVS